jgi:hypothetical protein
MIHFNVLLQINISGGTPVHGNTTSLCSDTWPRLSGIRDRKDRDFSNFSEKLVFATSGLIILVLKVKVTL